MCLAGLGYGDFLKNIFVLRGATADSLQAAKDEAAGSGGTRVSTQGGIKIFLGRHIGVFNWSGKNAYVNFLTTFSAGRGTPPCLACHKTSALTVLWQSYNLSISRQLSGVHVKRTVWPPARAHAILILA
jgi:hypothetical protein